MRDEKYMVKCDMKRAGVSEMDARNQGKWN